LLVEKINLSLLGRFVPRMKKVASSAEKEQRLEEFKVLLDDYDSLKHSIFVINLDYEEFGFNEGCPIQVKVSPAFRTHIRAFQHRHRGKRWGKPKKEKVSAVVKSFCHAKSEKYFSKKNRKNCFRITEDLAERLKTWHALPEGRLETSIRPGDLLPFLVEGKGKLIKNF
jgi:hypothetical protein